MFQIERAKNISGARKLRNWALNCMFLTLLLSVPWAVGYLGYVPGINQDVVSYAFIGLNGTVGVYIFVHRVLLNHRIMEVSTRYIRRKMSSPDYSSKRTTSTQKWGRKPGQQARPAAAAVNGIGRPSSKPQVNGRSRPGEPVANGRGPRKISNNATSVTVVSAGGSRKTSRQSNPPMRKQSTNRQY